MKKLTKDEMLKVSGSGLSGNLINAIKSGIMSIVDIGRYFGSAMRRLVERNLCKY